MNLETIVNIDLYCTTSFYSVGRIVVSLSDSVDSENTEDSFMDDDNTQTLLQRLKTTMSQKTVLQISQANRRSFQPSKDYYFYRKWVDGGVYFIQESGDIIMVKNRDRYKEIKLGTEDITENPKKVYQITASPNDVLLQADGSWRIVRNQGLFHGIRKIGKILSGSFVLKIIADKKLRCTPEQLSIA